MKQKNVILIVIIVVTIGILAFVNFQFDLLHKTYSPIVTENGVDIKTTAYNRGNDQTYLFFEGEPEVGKVLLIDHKLHQIYMALDPQKFMGLQFYESSLKYPGIAIDDMVKVEKWDYSFEKGIYTIVNLDSASYPDGSHKVALEDYELVIRF